MAIQKLTPHLNNLNAFLTQAAASADYKKDLELIKSTYNITQAQMAQQFGVSQMAISKWLGGKVKPKCLITIHLTAEELRKHL